MSNEHLCRGGPEDGKQCACGLTQVQLKEAGVGIGQTCPECPHTYGRHPAGPQAQAGGGGPGQGGLGGNGQAAFVKSEDGTRYKSARHSGVLPNSTYSPMSYTPNTEAFLTTNEDALYYFNLIKKAFSRINDGKHPKDQFHLKLSGGRFEIAKGYFTVVQINNVTTAIALSNIYHVLKVMECDMDGLVVYLKEFGVPTLIVATRTGNTPPYDAVDFELDGLYDNAQTCHL